MLDVKKKSSYPERREKSICFFIIGHIAVPVKDGGGELKQQKQHTVNHTARSNGAAINQKEDDLQGRDHGPDQCGDKTFRFAYHVPVIAHKDLLTVPD